MPAAVMCLPFGKSSPYPSSLTPPAHILPWEGFSFFNSFFMSLLCPRWASLATQLVKKKKKFSCNAGDLSLIPRLGSSPGEGRLPIPVFWASLGSDSKESTCNVGDLGSIPRLGRYPGGVHTTHSSILGWRIPLDRGA